MQILTGGSFVKLEQKDKIENLIFTAREMANAAVETDGFTNETENNQRLALDIWQGVEYMTLDHEEAQVKSIFVNHFLDRLREIGGANAAETVSQNGGGEEVDAPSATSENETPKDEFLGLVSTDEIEEKPAEKFDDSVVAPESRTVENAASASDEFGADVETDAAEIIEQPNETAAANVEPMTEKIETAEVKSRTVAATTETGEESESSDEKQAENDSPQVKVPGAITLPEKESYRWEKCTVTATIQLLPTADDSDAAKRKVVLSVRTHDFAPQFSVLELEGGDSILSELLTALEKSFERYKTDLPLKVMDKMKREKSAPKKQTGKTTVAAATSAAKTSSGKSQPKTDAGKTEKPVAKTESAKPTTATTDAPKPAAVVPAASGQQGSLFNF